VLFLVVVFVGLIIFLAFYLNALLDRREEKRLRKDSEKKGRGPL
jgi:protein-S-isoprenylcysteine O-methyltransferase Ste14